MGEATKIQWTHHTFNPWIGCEKVSPGCDHCYAEAGSRRLGAQHGLKLWQGDRYFTGPGYWQQLPKWDRAARATGERRRVFCASFADVFEDRRDLDVKRSVLGDRIYATEWLDYLLLTKRIEHAQRLGDAMFPRGWPPNVWLGTTVEDQRRADERIPHLLATRGPAVRFVSYEPALGPVRFREQWMVGAFDHCPDETDDPATDECAGCTGVPGDGDHCGAVRGARLDWIIVGGESGPRSRPFEITWARDVVRQCRAAGVAPFVKQLGAEPMFEAFEAVRHAITDKKGGDWSEWPADLRVREFPRGAV